MVTDFPEFCILFTYRCYLLLFIKSFTGTVLSKPPSLKHKIHCHLNTLLRVKNCIYFSGSPGCNKVLSTECVFKKYLLKEGGKVRDEKREQRSLGCQELLTQVL